MNKFLTVLMFHLKEGLSAKSFKITIVILFAAILGFFGFTHYFGQDEKMAVSVVNSSPKYKLDVEHLNKVGQFGKFKEAAEADLKKLKGKVKDGDTDALLVVSGDAEHPSVEYFHERVPSFELVNLVKAEIQPQYLNKVMVDKQVQPETAQALLTEVPIKEKPLKKSDSTGLVYFFIFLMYLFIMMFGQMVSMSVSGEKTSRVMEIMITKVKPIVMMYAKIISSMIIGLSQILAVAAGYGLSKAIGWTTDELTLFSMPLDLSVLNVKVFLFLALYFSLGFILYALLYAAVASVINRLEDISSVVFPVSLLLMGGFFLGMKSMFNPNDTMVVIGSYFPFFSPIVTFSRIVLGEASVLEIVLSLLILVAAILVIGIFANRIYLNGVMRYTSKTTLKDVVKLAKSG